METLATASGQNKKENTTYRRYDLDWLRVVTIIAVFLFHTARFFDFDGWHIKNHQLSAGFTLFTMVLSLWIMPVMFTISGAAAYWALGPRGPIPFLRARMLRLLVPLLFGIFFLSPHQVYLERGSQGRFAGSFFDFLPHYFDGWYGFGGNFAWMGLHLWYLEMLFIFSLLALPIFLFLLSGAGRQAGSLVARTLVMPGAVLVLGIPIMFFEAFIPPAGPGTRDFGGWDIFAYFWFFLCGYFLATQPSVELAAHRLGYLYLGLAFIVTAVVLATVLPVGLPVYGATEWVVVMGLRGMVGWCGVLGFMALARRFGSRNHPWLGRANEAVLPFYILHQPVIVLAGASLAAWPLGVLPKYLALATVSLAVIMMVYEYLVRRISILRFLFGMKV